jgi:T4 bacteriophage base plate protein
MDSKPTNPLAGYFRRPAIYIKVPSRGKYWEEGSIELPVTGEIPVYPMTTADEITLKTPDALMNGSSVVTVIQSCCPSIKDAWKMPSIDVDAVLIAIRIASYGTNMDVSTRCPHCNEEHDHSVNLTNLLDKIQAPNFDIPVVADKLKIKLKPQQYFSVTKANLASYEEQRIMKALSDPDITDEVRNATIKESMARVVKLNDDLLVGGTEYIETEDGVRVTESAFIAEFYKNADARVMRDIQARIDQLARDGAIPLMNVKCGEEDCGKEYQVPLEFDFSRFFAVGS